MKQRPPTRTARWRCAERRLLDRLVNVLVLDEGGFLHTTARPNGQPA
ncbi:hypothetical protein [Streptomyces sp. NRRL S-1022]|nr:hypothetical protein [Streptomyces sp. NRRL S-1022]